MRFSWSSECPLLAALVLTLVFMFAAAGGASAQGTQPLTYPGDAYVALNYVQTDKAADFENLWTKLKESLQKSTNETRKKQAEGWTVFKSSTPTGVENVTLYLVVINPVVKDADYTLWKILQEAFPEEYRDIYNKYSASFRESGTKIVPVNLGTFVSMK